MGDGPVQEKQQEWLTSHEIQYNEQTFYNNTMDSIHLAALKSPISDTDNAQFLEALQT